MLTVGLNAIAVDDEHRRQGMGRALMNWGVEQAEERGQDVWLVAAPTGRAMYESAGFKEVANGTRCGEGQYVMTKFRTSDK